MGTPKSPPLFTVDQYLALERTSEERHEYLDGVIYAMAGESLAHGYVSVNLVVSLGTQLKGNPCAAFTKDTKVRSGPDPKQFHATKGMFSYPDIVVVCDEPQFHDDKRDIILNPKAIFEVLSPATETFDRSEKFERLQQWNPSLTDYVLVSQDRPHIDHFARQPDGKWLLSMYDGLETNVPLPSIQCTLKMVDVYDRVKFDAV